MKKDFEEKERRLQEEHLCKLEQEKQEKEEQLRLGCYLIYACNDLCAMKRCATYRRHLINELSKPSPLLQCILQQLLTDIHVHVLYTCIPALYHAH